MNRFQKIVVAGAIINMIVLALFPPYDVASLTRGVPVFDAFYPVFAVPPHRTVNANLLYFAMFAVLCNSGLMWMLFGDGKGGRPRVVPRNVVVPFAFVNLMLVFLFPPFEALPMAGRFGGGSFDGFQFIFGGTGRRTVFLPLLYVEAIYVLINACAYWLALTERSASSVIEESIGDLISEEDRIRREIDSRIRAEAKAAGRAAGKKPGPEGS